MSQNWNASDWTASNWDANNWLGPNEEAPPGSISATLSGSSTFFGDLREAPQRQQRVELVGGWQGKKRKRVVLDDTPSQRETLLKQDEEEVLFLISRAMQEILLMEELWEH